MSRYELSVSPDYVPDWTEVEAVRELFQNALDSEGEMDWYYANSILTITNEKAKLDKNTLLFGTTSKSNDKEAIGHFGEGYKLAFLVLARMGYKVKVINPTNETWEPKIIKSKRYNSDLLVVDILTKPRFTKVPLTFQIHNLKQKIFDKICESNLHMKPVCTYKETDYGDILEGSDYKGKIFIKGLYVCTKEDLEYGYNILPQFLQTNRDRNLVTDFDIHWVTSQIWADIDKPMKISQMVEKEVIDIRYINNFSKKDLNETMYQEFCAMHGKYAIPVVDQEEFDLIRKNYKKLKPVFVKPLAKDIIYRGCSSYGTGYAAMRSKATKRIETRLPEVVIAEFFKKNKYEMKDKTKSNFKRLLELSKDWTLK